MNFISASFANSGSKALIVGETATKEGFLVSSEDAENCLGLTPTMTESFALTLVEVMKDAPRGRSSGPPSVTDVTFGEETIELNVEDHSLDYHIECREEQNTGRSSSDSSCSADNPDLCTVESTEALDDETAIAHRRRNL